jgi:hypothetical protein
MELTETFWPKGSIVSSPDEASDNKERSDAQKHNSAKHDRNPNDKDIEREFLGLFFRCHFGNVT